MRNREGGPSEKKDVTYFSQKIQNLIEESESNGQPDMATILTALKVTLESKKAVNELARLCADFGLNHIETPNKVG